MIDAYKYDPEGVANVIISLKNRTKEYNDKVVELTKLVNSINESSSWRDVDIKTSFVNTCSSYIKIYNNLIQAMDIYINYLSKKSEIASSIEDGYARDVYG